MKKKLLLLSTIFMVIFSNLIMVGNVVLAESNDDFSMEIPSEYKSMGKNAWIKSNGDNVNVQVKAHNSKINGSLDKALKELLEETCKLSIYSDIETKEVSKYTNNKYKGIHIIAKVSGSQVYVEQYAFISDKNTYVITFSSTSKDYFSSDEVKSMIDSFTIPNYKKPQNNSALSVTLRGALIGAVVGAIIGGIKAIKKKSKKE